MKNDNHAPDCNVNVGFENGEICCCHGPKTETIDITPEGCKTPEGNKRVNDAMTAFQESREEVARLATSLLRNETILDILRAGLEAQEEHEAIDQLDALYDAVGVRMRAEEDFVLAVAGKPKRYAATLNGKTVQVTIPE